LKKENRGKKKENVLGFANLVFLFAPPPLFPRIYERGVAD